MSSMGIGGSAQSIAMLNFYYSFALITKYYYDKAIEGGILWQRKMTI